MSEAALLASEKKLVRAPFMYKQWMVAGNTQAFIRMLTNDFGDFVHYRGILNFYVINHPDLIRQVLQKTNKKYDKGTDIYTRFRAVFKSGLVTSEGAHWAKQRKLIQPLLKPVFVRSLVPLMCESSAGMADEWSQSSGDGTMRNVARDMSRLTLEIAGKCLFSSDFEGYRTKIIEWSEFINEYSGMTPYPVIRSPWFPSPANFKMKRVLREFHDFVGALYDDRVRGGSKNQDLFSLLLGARHEELEGGMSREELTDEVVTMIFGGHETSATALTWAWSLLAQNKDVEAKLHEELDTVLNGRDPRPEDVSKLKYTKMVIDEAMRMGPPFWFENRNAIEEDELWGETIPEGSLIMFSRHAMHMHPEFWDNPTEFRPERFAPSASKERTKFAYIPFGGGPRICAGITFATIELVIALATLANKFTIELDESASTEVEAKLTMTPKGGVPAYIKLRNRP